MIAHSTSRSASSGARSGCGASGGRPSSNPSDTLRCRDRYGASSLRCRGRPAARLAPWDKASSSLRPRGDGLGPSNRGLGPRGGGRGSGLGGLDAWHRRGGRCGGASWNGGGTRTSVHTLPRWPAWDCNLEYHPCAASTTTTEWLKCCS